MEISPNATPITKACLILANGNISDTTMVLTITSCSSSILGAVAIFMIYFKCQNIRTSSRRLLLFLTIADFLTASSNLVGIIRYMYSNNSVDNWSDGLCVAQSVVTTYSNMCSFFWTAAISFFILMPVAKHFEFGRKFEICCHIFCWIVPGVIVAIAASHKNTLGEDRAHTSGGWCWINGCSKRRIMWMVITGKGWEISVYIITAVNYILLKYLMYRRQQQEVKGNRPHGILFNEQAKYQLKIEDKNFLYVPMLLYCLRVWGTIRFFLSISGADFYHVKSTIHQISDYLQPLQGFGDSGQAFWNFVLFFVLDSSIRPHFTPCCKRNDSAPFNAGNVNQDDHPVNPDEGRQERPAFSDSIRGSLGCRQGSVRFDDLSIDESTPLVRSQRLINDDDCEL